MIYYGLVKPFKDPFMNKLEIFNEISIVIVGYHLYLFTDYVDDPYK